MKRNQLFNARRLRVLIILACCAGVVIAWRLIDIQLVSHQRYARTAEENRTQIIYQTAPRGRILANNGAVIAGSLPAFSLYYMPAGRAPDKEYAEAFAADIALHLAMPKEEVLGKLNSAFKSGKATLLLQNVSPQKIFAAAELQVYYSGLYILDETKRYYPLGPFASHMIGYMGAMDNKSWLRLGGDADYRLNSKIGKSGIEKHYEADLKGRDGGLILEVDHVGRVKRIIKDSKWRAGSDIYTTLNFDAQKAAQDGIKNSLTGRGAVVALDPGTGAVLAMASAPDFDPNLFTPYGDEEASQGKKISIPEYNLAIQGLYPPASPFKIITAIAAAQTGRLDIHEKVNCTGKIILNGREFKCWHRHGENIDFMEGMAQSCDTYFYTLGLKTGASHIEQIERMFRFGRQTGIDLPFEKSGNLYGPAKRARNKTYWFGGDTLNLSIGQGELLVTPVQMAVFAAALASKGKIWRPYYIERIAGADGKDTFRSEPQQVAEAKLKDGVYELMHKSLKGVVDNATGRAARIKGIDVYGKTGTAQNPHGDDHGWFVAFSAREGQEPDFAIAVLIEHGKGGAGAAAPVAREVMKAFYGVK
jgi:penicillin-binding protein 2